MLSPIAVIAAHPDDEVLGCGGTLARMVKNGCVLHILILADGESSRLENNQIDNSMLRNDRYLVARNAAKLIGCEDIEFLSLPDNRLDSLDRLKIIKHIEGFIKKNQPKTIFTHHAGDVNIDHRIVHDAVIAACRPQPGYCVTEILFFEVPSSTEWRPPGSAIAFNPNFFVDISETLQIKLSALEAYNNELRPFPHPRSLEAVEALAKWRGATVGVSAAEAFIIGRKLV